MRYKITSIIAVLILVACFASARTQLPRYQVNDSSYYTSLVTNVEGFNEYSDFDLAKSDFYTFKQQSTEGYEEVLGSISMASNKYSSYGLNYTIGFYVTVDKNEKVTLNPNLTREQQIRDAINQFESKEEVIQFASITGNAGNVQLSVLSHARLNVGDYFLEYDLKKDEFTRYSVPSSMSDKFPLVATFKGKVEDSGCTIAKDAGIAVIKNEYWNTITLTSLVEGTCKKSDKYMGGSTFEVEMPLKNDFWSKFVAWFRGIFR
ncbi:hypothetical protein J4401_04595 [Candidatus Woesearchaeota archaeon]|nr:hypothetical protein [Candidatus Woesearchaeota archaeon]